MTSCRFLKQCGDFLRGALSPKDEGFFREHLPGCGTCQRQLEREERLTVTLNALQTPVLPESLAERTLQLVLAEMEREPRPGKSWRDYLSFLTGRWKILVPATATIALLLTIAGYKADIFEAQQEAPTIFSLAHLRQSEPEITYEDHYFSFLNVQGRERSEVNEVLAHLSRDTLAVSYDGASLVQSIDYSTRQAQILPATYMYLTSSEGMGQN